MMVYDFVQISKCNASNYWGDPKVMSYIMHRGVLQKIHSRIIQCRSFNEYYKNVKDIVRNVMHM